MQTTYGVRLASGMPVCGGRYDNVPAADEVNLDEVDSGRDVVQLLSTIGLTA
ncbi:MAG: hypothetical protein R3C56_08750 [Pirellulaceae bacterium]